MESVFSFGLTRHDAIPHGRATPSVYWPNEQSFCSAVGACSDQMLMQDSGAARKSYEHFLALWKDADPDIPVYRQAKAEYAALRTSVTSTD